MRYLNINSPTGGSGVSTLAVLLAFTATTEGQAAAIVAPDDDSCGDILAMCGLPHISDVGVYSLGRGVDLYNLTHMGTVIPYDVVIFDNCVIPAHLDRHQVTATQTVTVVPASYNGLRKATRMIADAFVYRTNPARVLGLSDAQNVLSNVPVIEWSENETVARAADAGLTTTKAGWDRQIKAIYDTLGLPSDLPTLTK